MAKKVNLGYVRDQLSHGAYIRIASTGNVADIGLYKTFYYPFERGVCLGNLTARQFKILYNSGFIYCDYETSNGDGYFAYYLVGGAD